jgi:2-iminobutanoate/2-iminopropanoate deaminase
MKFYTIANLRTVGIVSALASGIFLHGCGGASAQSVGTTSGVAVQRINYPSILGPAVGPYTQAVKHNGFLYLSGLSAFASPAQDKPIADQADVIIRQIESVAVAEGTDLKSLIKVTIFVTSLDDIAPLRAKLFERYGVNLPASSLVQVVKLFDPSVKIEIEAVLAVK